MSSPATQYRQRPASFPLQQQQQQQQQQPLAQSLIAAEAEQLSAHVIERHRNTTEAVCKSLQARVLELRSDTNKLKRSASELIRETGKRVRSDFKHMVETVHAGTKAQVERETGTKISAIWKRNSGLTEENTMLSTQLSEQKRRSVQHQTDKQSLCHKMARSARTQIASLRREQQAVRDQLAAARDSFDSLRETLQDGVTAFVERETCDAAAQTDAAQTAEASAQTAAVAICTAGVQTGTSCSPVNADAECQTMPASESPVNVDRSRPVRVGDYVVQADELSAALTLGRVMHILPPASDDEEQQQKQAYVQLYERTWRTTQRAGDSIASSATPAGSAVASPIGTAPSSPIEYWRHAINKCTVLPVGSLQVVSCKRGFWGHVIDKEASSRASGRHCWLI